jgi:hypothetical protein
MRGTTAAEFAAHLRSQIGVSTKLVSDLGLKAEQHQNDTFRRRIRKRVTCASLGWEYALRCILSENFARA